jgi:hypothetical protein
MPYTQTKMPCNRSKPQLKRSGSGLLTLTLWGVIAVLAGGFFLGFIEKKDWLGVALMSIGFVWFLWSNAKNDPRQ